MGHTLHLLYSCLKYNEKKPTFIFVNFNGHITSIIYSNYYRHIKFCKQNTAMLIVLRENTVPWRAFTRPRTINKGHTVTSTYISLIGKKKCFTLFSKSRFSKGLYVCWDTFPHLLVNCLISKHKFAVVCSNVCSKKIFLGR